MQGTQYATKRSILCRGAFCGPTLRQSQQKSSAFLVRSLYGKQCVPRSDCSYKAVCSGSTLFASSVMLGNYLQQTTSADDIFRCIFFSWRFKG